MVTEQDVCYACGMESRRSLRDVGGTSGGLGEFVAGFVMACAGGWLLIHQVTVMSSFWSLFGMNASGLSLVPVLVGVGFLFFDGRSILGWLLTAGGVIFLFVGIIANLHIYFRPTSLFNTILMLGLLAGGLGLIARSLRAHRNAAAGEEPGQAP